MEPGDLEENLQGHRSRAVVTEMPILGSSLLSPPLNPIPESRTHVQHQPAGHDFHVRVNYSTRDSLHPFSETCSECLQVLPSPFYKMLFARHHPSDKV